MNLILGAGLSGLSCSFHLGHKDSIVLEKAGNAYGHIRTEFREGFTWDEGPHVSFTTNDYVRSLFAESVGNNYDEYEVHTSNYYKGSWIDHPAQTSLYQIPEPLRSACVESFLRSRRDISESHPRHYGEWLEQAFGPVFAQTFPAAYTRKYWTLPPEGLSTEWVGSRVFYPSVEEVTAGSRGPLNRQTHYISKIRYPTQGGFQAFASKLKNEANIRLGADVCSIDLQKKCLWTIDGTECQWGRLINTLPLPKFLSMCANVPHNVMEAAREISCSNLLLINFQVDHSTRRSENWMYVYDEDKLSTRINCTEKLTRGNAPFQKSGIQVEVYGSRHRPLPLDFEVVARKVAGELMEMGLLDPEVDFKYHTVLVPWANIIFTHSTAAALEMIWQWLEKYGLEREGDDLHPLTNWSDKAAMAIPLGSITMAGRYAQWKYFWTDDCVLRGAAIAGRN